MCMLQSAIFSLMFSCSLATFANEPVFSSNGNYKYTHITIIISTLRFESNTITRVKITIISEFICLWMYSSYADEYTLQSETKPYALAIHFVNDGPHGTQKLHRPHIDSDLLILAPQITLVLKSYRLRTPWSQGLEAATSPRCLTGVANALLQRSNTTEVANTKWPWIV